MKIELKGEELHEAIDDGKEIACEPWRWGTTHTYVYEKAPGQFFRFTVQYHCQDGLQDDSADAVEVRAVEKVVTTKVWEVV